MKSFDEIKQYLEYVLLGKPGTKAISQTSTSAYLWPFVEEVEKAVKALEIFKKEPFISANWYLEGTYEEYVNAIETVKITEDEWNIVKEVLCQ